MKTRSTKYRQLRLTLLFTAVVLAILLLTMVLVFIGVFTLYKLGRLDENTTRAPFLLLGIVSVVLGTAIAAIFSRVPLRPVRNLISATDSLAKGDFSARIDLKGSNELQRLSESFNHMAEELGSIELLRSDFVNNFSHEFKTPIVSVRGFAKILKRDDLTKAERDEFLDIIISEADRLSALATNVLNLSKIENQAILADRARFNVSEQLRRVIALLENRWRQKNIEINFDSGEIYLTANEELLSQVWINLLDNAIKFSPENAQIDIRLSKDSGFISVLVADQGNGMSQEAALHVFDKFYQGDTAHTLHGNGLGLTLAKRITDLHGGTIGIVSTGAGGSTFEVRLPG